MIAHFLFDVDEPENARHALMQSTTGKGTASAVPIEHVPVDWRAQRRNLLRTRGLVAVAPDRRVHLVGYSFGTSELVPFPVVVIAQFSGGATHSLLFGCVSALIPTSPKSGEKCGILPTLGPDVFVVDQGVV